MQSTAFLAAPAGRTTRSPPPPSLRQCASHFIAHSPRRLTSRRARLPLQPLQQPPSPPRAPARMTGEPVNVDAPAFEAEVLASDVPVLVDFHAPWCGPCKLMQPLMEWAAAEYDGKLKVVKVNTEENESFVKDYAIYGLPTFIVFNGGSASTSLEGVLTKAALVKFLTKNAPTVVQA